MKKIILLTLSLSLSNAFLASTLFDQLCRFNPNWLSYRDAKLLVPEQELTSDIAYIQLHLTFVLEQLNNADVAHLNARQKATRNTLLLDLAHYRNQAIFPINYFKLERIPVFIDENGTHCAVGYLMQQSGYASLAQAISKSDNYVWVKDLSSKEVLKWQQLSGFSMDELKLIQGAYDSYHNNALFLPNRISVPQKPEVTLRFFSEKKNGKLQDKEDVWLHGEGKNGVLHGRWVQNYAKNTPWIIGFYQNGKRAGKWFEYYQGTQQLCRSEHWENDQLNGIRTRYNRAGKIIEEIEFKDGKAVLKTNYELSDSLKFVRKPIDSTTVMTMIYNNQNKLIAQGKERIHNPGHLQWFQNIELTALNTMSLSAQQLSVTSVPSLHVLFEPSKRMKPQSTEIVTPSLYEVPPLVTYIKEGDWVYYSDFSAHFSKKNERYNQLPYAKELNKSFAHFGTSISQKLTNKDHGLMFKSVDSLQVTYQNDDILDLIGFGKQTYFHLSMSYFPASSLPYMVPYSNFMNYSSSASLKTLGYYDSNGRKIGDWLHYDKNGNLVRKEQFFVPWKKEDELTEEVKLNASFQQ